MGGFRSFPYASLVTCCLPPGHPIEVEARLLGRPCTGGGGQCNPNEDVAFGFLDCICWESCTCPPTPTPTLRQPGVPGCTGSYLPLPALCGANSVERMKNGNLLVCDRDRVMEVKPDPSGCGGDLVWEARGFFYEPTPGATPTYCCFMGSLSRAHEVPEHEFDCITNVVICIESGAACYPDGAVLEMRRFRPYDPGASCTSADGKAVWIIEPTNGTNAFPFPTDGHILEAMAPTGPGAPQARFTTCLLSAGAGAPMVQEWEPPDPFPATASVAQPSYVYRVERFPTTGKLFMPFFALPELRTMIADTGNNVVVSVSHKLVSIGQIGGAITERHGDVNLLPAVVTTLPHDLTLPASCESKFSGLGGPFISEWLIADTGDSRVIETALNKGQPLSVQWFWGQNCGATLGLACAPAPGCPGPPGWGLVCQPWHFTRE